MASGVDLDSNSNPWVVTFNGSTASLTLPAQIWPLTGYAGPISPFIVKRIVWIGVSSAQGDEVILKDLAPSPGPNKFAEFVATGADFEPPQEWKRAKDEGAPYGCQITTFASGVLYLYF